MKKSILGIIFSILAIAFTNSCNNATTANANENDSIAIEDSLDNELKKGWIYSNTIDKMDGYVAKEAFIVSSNVVEFDPPYNGGSTLQITICQTKENGSGVAIGISNGQFVYNEFNGNNYVIVKFDNDAPVKFSTLEPTDGSTNMLFIENPKKFINLAKNAKTIKIEASFFTEGSHVFTFNTENPLKW